MKRTVILVDEKADKVQEVTVETPNYYPVDKITKMLRAQEHGLSRKNVTLYADGEAVTVRMYYPRGVVYRYNTLALRDRPWGGVFGSYVLVPAEDEDATEKMLSVLRPCYKTGANIGERPGRYAQIEVDDCATYYGW